EHDGIVHGAWSEGRTACTRSADVSDADHGIRLRGGNPGDQGGHPPVSNTLLPVVKDEKDPALITFENVTKRYPDGTVAVDGLNLEIPDGQIMVLVGPSGGGKTTSLRMINRLVDPTSGRILLDGKDIQGSNPAILRRGIGYVIQQGGLF